MSTIDHSRRRPTPSGLLSLVPAGVFVAWLAVACYALAYLVTH
jgi:hypothetical protein